MELKKFIQLFAEQFDNTPLNVFEPKTRFKELKEWSSLTALSIISMVDEEMDKSLSGTELRSVNTIEELLVLLNNK